MAIVNMFPAGANGDGLDWTFSLKPFGEEGTGYKVDSDGFIIELCSQSNYTSVATYYGALYWSQSVSYAISLPRCSIIGSSAFRTATNIFQVDFPACETIYNYAFYGCYHLSSIHFPACKSIPNYAFGNCSSLTTVSFPECTSISTMAFYRCQQLSSVYLTGSAFVQLGNSNAFSGTSIGSSKGSIYVPSSMLASYKTTTNWTYYSARLFGV